MQSFSPGSFTAAYFKGRQAPSRCAGRDPGHTRSPHLLAHHLQLSHAGPLLSLSSASPSPSQASPPKWQHWGTHPWKECLLHQNPEVLNCAPPAKAFIIHPKPWGVVGLYSISPAYKGSSADFRGLTVPQIPPLQVKQQSSSPCTATYHLCCPNSSC